MQFKAPVAVNSRNNFDLSHNHTMSHNFGVLSCVSWLPVVPGDKIDVRLNSFTRLMPLPCPTFGGVKLIKRAFFVPYEFVMRGFSDYLNDVGLPGQDGNYTSYAVPYTTVDEIYQSFVLDSRICYVPSTPGSRTDFQYDGIGYVYTSYGRKLRSFLHQIGISLPLYCFHREGSSPNKNSYADTRFDLLKLLSWWKFYIDWVVPARFSISDPTLVQIRYYLEHEIFTSNNCFFQNPSVQETTLFISDLLKVPVSMLEDDYYVSVFKTAYGPENISFVGTNGLDVLQSGSGTGMRNPSVSQYYDNEPLVSSGSTSYNAFLSQVQLLSLGRLQNMINDRKITDSHVLDYLKLTYGVAPSKDALRFSSYLGSSDNVIQIGDVMSTANTQVGDSVTYVGQYAGKGVGYDESKFHCESDKHGVLFITCEIQAKTSYVNGLSPLSQQLTREAFFNPNFDNVGVRAVAHSELVFNCFDSPESNADLRPDSDFAKTTDIFGYAPRYSEYKFKDDVVSGDFICPSVNSGMDSWYLSRQFTFFSKPKINLDFVSAASDTVGSSYDRIFQNTNNDDHFYTIFRVGIKASRPMESMTQYFETIDSETDGKKSIDKSNNNII